MVVQPGVATRVMCSRPFLIRCLNNSHTKYGAMRELSSPMAPKTTIRCSCRWRLPIDGTSDFNSGCRHATWLAAVAEIVRPMSGTDEKQVWMFMVPREDVGLVDVWHVNGLRRTGTLSFEVEKLYVLEGWTFDIAVKDLFIPSDASYENGALYVVPVALLFACGFVCVVLGVARAGVGRHD